MKFWSFCSLENHQFKRYSITTFDFQFKRYSIHWVLFQWKPVNAIGDARRSELGLLFENGNFANQGHWLKFNKMIFLIANELCKVQVFQTFIFQLQIHFDLFLDSYADCPNCDESDKYCAFFLSFWMCRKSQIIIYVSQKNIQNRLLRIQFVGINQSTQVSAGVCTVQSLHILIRRETFRTYLNSAGILLQSEQRSRPLHLRSVYICVSKGHELVNIGSDRTWILYYD